MLEMRPNCECCDKNLAPNSTEAMICTYECTFCESCVNEVLHNVCPNCGGGFSARPVRPRTEWRSGLSVKLQPASNKRVHTQFSRKEITAYAEKIRGIKPENR
jgi:uncharacterized protein